MDDRRGSLDLSEEIELCGKLRNDIGKALKADAHNAAKYGTYTAYVYLLAYVGRVCILSVQSPVRV